jgi:hypothetical protein
MNTVTPIGKAICDAFTFLRGVHKDVLSVVQTLDAIMAANEWYPTFENRISDDLSNGSYTSDKWLIRSIYRIYVNDQQHTEAAERVIAVHITFDPPESYGQPVCLCIYAKFPSPTSTREMWNRWSYVGSEKLLEHLGGADEFKAIPKHLFRALLPQAETGSAFAVNLCGLTSEPVVKQKLADQILGMVDGK